MKNNITTGLKFSGLLSLLLLFSSCLKDDCRHTYKITVPVYAKLSVLRASVQSTAPQPINNTGKLYVNGDRIYLNEPGKGIHVIDNSRPDHPVQTAFLKIPGNVDMYIKDNILYADMYCDLAAIDISNPANIAVKKFLTKTFPDKAINSISTNPDSIDVITGWTTRDTTVSCAANGSVIYPGGIAFYSQSAASSSGPKQASGAAGSMARFAAVNDYLYTVSTSSLSVINISEASNPVFIQAKNIGWNIETIFPYNNKLYLGARSSMSVYDLQSPANPQLSASASHWCSGDPVVADDHYAYVTLHAANICDNTVNQLEIYSFSSLQSAALVKTYPLSNPQGLSKEGNLLFICDGKDGLKIFDASNVTALKMIKQLSGMETYDVIAANGIAYLVAKDGLYQYDYSDTANIQLLSKLTK
jgi:hypothetical protein